jgi:hypothetical protein
MPMSGEMRRGCIDFRVRQPLIPPGRSYQTKNALRWIIPAKRILIGFELENEFAAKLKLS